ncbi:ATP-binding protein [Flavihumibacter fluvii]|uniref:ATP-binding protein n=1 Tax=Flavihumibacter fluvii TaxID=2838157 RepID=UPI001BDDEAA2|nr:ATP-binding protein [Flavihumibacter fluvii]ULQ51014.1 ATP-binding protein [Flavihumibacter fluvii]
MRSFTEEESLYFKGREDDIDQATAQLQRNKFLMLTGASGDGKSSLVYAGIIPNARSGFLKSKYSHWCVADFRPERTPFQNLVTAVARQLDIPNQSTVQAELNHGFSALVDLYKNSKRYLDTESLAWMQADDAAKASLRRGAANLIILVDQFEEFFTNPENYHQGSPSKEANLVLNILLETTRIALEEDLPIYVIFTMRSDYIGQCAAFRGLPEYIGFSQFFVPRLNRSQLQMVIEEPATLSGNRITRRLTERLIHDLTEGVDQLPILQHALNQIWVAADEGAAEMDLLHYAMVGGMSFQELPEEQVSRFNAWFEKLPAEIKACYHAPSLQNVLDTHTNKLYEQAADYYSQKTGKQISREDAQLIIRTTFTCLTKIDQGRAVRNRMNLTEITHILGQPALDTATVGMVLNIFREPGNTFIRPFINPEQPETMVLQPGQVLDITHESLIRNWLYLGQWAKEEFDNHSVSLDFEQQLGRWVNSGKSNNFLLPIGPLTYFETWYKKVKPNAWWIARYLPEEAKEEMKFIKANEILNNGREFLHRSAGKHVVTRTIMRYGPKRIAAVLGLLALVILTVFGISTYLSRQNETVLKKVRQQTLLLAANPTVKMDPKITLLVETLKQQQISLRSIFEAIQKPVEKVNLANGIATLLILQGKEQPKDLVLQCLRFSDSVLATIPVEEKDPKQMAAVLKEINDFRVILEFAYGNIPDLQIEEWRTRNVQRAALWAMFIAKQQPEGFKDIQQFTLALEYAISNQAYSPDEIGILLHILSSFENQQPSKWLQENFKVDKILLRGELGYGAFFNGLYQEMAYLYGAAGNSEKALQCIDTLLKYNQNYYQGDYGTHIDNASNIAAVFFSNGQTTALNSFVKGYCERKKLGEDEFYARWLGRTLHERSTNGNLELYFWMDNFTNINVTFTSNKQLALLFAKYREVIQSGTGDADKKNLQLAISYKDQGIATAKGRIFPAEPGYDANGCFDQAMNFYRKVSSQFLSQTSFVIGSTATDNISLSRKAMFIYPDTRTTFHPIEPRSFFYFYFSDAFLEYILEKNLFDELYTTQEDFNLISNWLHDYNVKMFFPHGFLVQKARTSVFKGLEEELVRRRADSLIDLNLLYLYLGLDYQREGKTEEMVRYYKKLQPNTFINSLSISEFGGQPSNQAFRLMGFAVYGLTMAGHFDEAKKLIAVFKQPMNRSSLYAFAAINGLREKRDVKLVQQLIDSAKTEMKRAENVTVAQPNRQLIAFALAMQSPEKNAAEISSLIKNIPQKSPAFKNTCRSYAFNGNLFDAIDHIPASISENDRADFLGSILYGYWEKEKKSDSTWAQFDEYYRPFIIRFIQYVDENN